MTKMRDIKILETSLRDGSYVIDFQFTAKDTETIVRCLDQLHFPLIEIGHGLGINASQTKGRAACSDVDYIKAARNVSKDSKIGMFCIPGIATLDNLKACADAGLQFVRVGVNVDQFDLSKPFVEEARKLGLMVCTNFMKSYVLAPKDFAKLCQASADFGSDLVYLVDSAGGMMPDDVKDYIGAIRDLTSVSLGFHGHNNIQMAIINSLTAIEAGADVVDTTLLGLGRSSGNAATEILVPLIQRKFNQCETIDSLLLLELAETLVSPLLKNRWESSEKTILGLSQVHSMYTEKIRSAARKSDKLFYSVVQEVGRRDRINLAEATLKDAVQNAIPSTYLNEVFGDLTLLEELHDGSSWEEIARMSVKLNIPIKIDVEMNTKNRKVVRTKTEIRVLCEPQDAATFLDQKDSATKHLNMDQRDAQIYLDALAHERTTQNDRRIS